MSQTIRLMQQLAASGVELKGVTVGSDPLVTPDQVAAEIAKSINQLGIVPGNKTNVAEWYAEQQAKGLIGMHVSLYDTELPSDPNKVIEELMVAEDAIAAGQFREPPKATTETPVEVMEILKESKVSEPCDCECHTPGICVMHCMPCCDFTYQKVEGRHPNQSTIDFVSSLM